MFFSVEARLGYVAGGASNRGNFCSGVEMGRKGSKWAKWASGLLAASKRLQMQARPNMAYDQGVCMPLYGQLYITDIMGACGGLSAQGGPISSE